MEGDDPNFNAAGMGFSDKSIRAGFIRRVYSILSVSNVDLRKNISVSRKKAVNNNKQISRRKYF